MNIRHFKVGAVIASIAFMGIGIIGYDGPNPRTIIKASPSAKAIQSDAQIAPQPVSSQSGNVAADPYSSLRDYAVNQAVSPDPKGSIAKTFETKASSISLPFIENKGQVDPKVAFYARTFAGTAFITKDREIVYSLPYEDKASGKSPAVVIKERFAGLNKGQIHGEGLQKTKVSHIRGNDRSKWTDNVPSYEMVSLGEIDTGINIKIKAHGNNIEKLFFVSPGSDPSKIKAVIEGATALSVDKEGMLSVQTEKGDWKFTRPIAYQFDGADKKYVEVAYLAQNDEYGFLVGGYDKSKELIIDPLIASTFLSGSNDHVMGAIENRIKGIALDKDGNVYVTGPTKSQDFPTTDNAYDKEINTTGMYDIFVSKFDANLTTLLASTVIGGKDNDYPHDITVSDEGTVYVSGITSSTDFPTSSTGLCVSRDESKVAFGLSLTVDAGVIFSMDSGLSELKSMTYTPWGATLLYDKDKGLYAAMLQTSGAVILKTLDQNNSGYNVYDKMSSVDVIHSGDAILLFGKDLDVILTAATATVPNSGVVSDPYAYKMHMDRDSTGNFVIAVTAQQDNLPVSDNAFQKATTVNKASSSARGNLYIVKISSDLKTFMGGTYLGGYQGELISGVALDKDDNIFVTGRTYSTDFPKATSNYTINGNPSEGAVDDYGMYIAKISSDFTQLLGTVYVNGNSTWGGIKVDDNGDVYVSGGNGLFHPFTAGSFIDGFIWPHGKAMLMQFNSALNTLKASTLIGGYDGTQSLGMILGPENTVYVIGVQITYDEPGGKVLQFPITAGAYQSTAAANSDNGWIARLSNDLSACDFSLSRSSVKVAYNDISQKTVTLTTQPQCKWSVKSKPLIVTIVSGGEGTGPGDIVFTVNSKSYAKGGNILLQDNLGRQLTVGISVSPVETIPTDNAVSVSINGAGTIKSTDSKISCSNTTSSKCSYTYSVNKTQTVELRPTATSGYYFAGWAVTNTTSGETQTCSDLKRCRVALSGDKNFNVAATFIKPGNYTVNVTVNAENDSQGKVTGSVYAAKQITCSNYLKTNVCTQTRAKYTTSKKVTLTASSYGKGGKFSGWSGLCTGAARKCTFTIGREAEDSTYEVTASFTK